MKRTSTEAHVYMRRHQGAKVEHLDVSNVIYHKFSHRGVSNTLNGENVNVVGITGSKMGFQVENLLLAIVNF